LGNAAGVYLAALWNSTIDPLFTLLVTLSTIASTPNSFQSSESPFEYVLLM
jgi:hypothetical protein